LKNHSFLNISSYYVIHVPFYRLEPIGNRENLVDLTQPIILPGYFIKITKRVQLSSINMQLVVNIIGPARILWVKHKIRSVNILNPV